uniref:Uncharacterized protein n=1 Tax=viral metagenome TaxID=1070528 RepID=A0A6C0C694_9ZZZZ
MLSVAAILIQKTWRGYIFAHALPHAIAQKKSQELYLKKKHDKLLRPQD